MKAEIKTWMKSAGEMLFPNLCLSCQFETAIQEHEFCVSCLKEYYEADYDLIAENPVARHFYGRIPFEKAACLLNFQKGGISQSLLHALKYESRQDIGLRMGRRMGQLWERSSFFNTIEAIIPIPLHPKKLKLRGYNQAAVLAQGIHEITGIPVWDGVVIRNRATQTQTRKTRSQRLRNMRDAFELKRGNAPKLPQHALILDDVITTGATIESCALAVLQEFKSCKISIAALALG